MPKAHFCAFGLFIFLPKDGTKQAKLYKYVIVIGVDGTGKLNYALKASLDELMIFDDVLTQEDISALAEYYGSCGNKNE